MRTTTLLLRWSWRDLRAHWAKVVAIALVIAIGTGGYAGLTSTAEWRTVSYDLSYDGLAMYDLRVDMAAGVTVREGVLAGTVGSIDGAGDIEAVEERLIVPTQVDASTETETVLVRGEIVGADFTDGGPAVNAFHEFTGRPLGPADSGKPVVTIERNFAKFYELPDIGTLAVGGDRSLEFVAQATTPEYFTVAPEGGIFMSEATFAGLFTTLETAQDLAGAPGRVNNLVLTLGEGADRDSIAAQIEDALATGSLGATVATRDDNLSYSALTTDIEQDQAIFNVLAVLLLAGAVGAAFNLIHRLVEQQRREIGIGMAIGIKPRLLAVRPLLVSAQIALLGVVFGVAVGVLIGNAMGAVFTDSIPLPVWETAFQTGVFVRVAVIGLLVPFAASALPVWRAVRVRPIEAIKPSYYATRKSGASRSLRFRAKTFTVMPFRNLRRTPRRTALTILGIAAAVTVLVGFLGIMDSVFGAVDTAEAEATGDYPSRIVVTLDGFYPASGPEVAALGGAKTVDRAEPGLRVGGSAKTSIDEVDVFIELVDLRDGSWNPTIVPEQEPGAFGVILADKAGSDLGVSVGDTVTLRHPRRDGTSFSLVESDIPVLGLHPHPMRALAYMDMSQAGLLNLEGLANVADIYPAAGASTGDVQQELFAIHTVTSVQSVTATTDAVRDAFNQTLGIIQVMVVAILLLALLIAFNTAAINLDARAREHATMFAFGVRVRTALRMAVTESFVIGVLATAIGIGGGMIMVWWMTQRLLPETLPDFGLEVVLQATTLAVIVVMGVVAVTLAPLLTWRHMRSMDLPGTLRLVE